MKVPELREMARRAGIAGADGLFNEMRLVWAIQESRRQEACFRTDHRFTCRNTACEWRAECMKLVATWRR